MANNGIVNVCFAGVIAFFLSACGGSEIDTPAKAEGVVVQPANDPHGPDALQIIWGSRLLSLPVRELSVSRGQVRTILAQYSDGGLQIFDLELERLSPILESDLTHLSDGFDLELAGQRNALFFGLDKGRLVGVLYLPKLKKIETVSIDLSALQDSSEPEFAQWSDSISVLGVCAARAQTPAANKPDGENPILLAFWAEADPARFVKGHIAQAGNALNFIPQSITEEDFDIQGCALAEEDVIIPLSDPLDVIMSSIGIFKMTQTGLVSPKRLEPIVIADGVSLDMVDYLTASASIYRDAGPTLSDGVLVLAGSYEGINMSRILLITKKAMPHNISPNTGLVDETP